MILLVHIFKLIQLIILNSISCRNSDIIIIKLNLIIPAQVGDYSDSEIVL